MTLIEALTAEITNLIDALTAEIAKAYKLSHTAMPQPKEMQNEAMLILADTQSYIPNAWVIKCYIHARLHGVSYIPTSRTIIKAWEDAIRDQYRAEQQKPAIEPSKAHSCDMCTIVALRLGITPPNATEGEIKASKERVTLKELNCIRATAKPYVLRYWNNKPDSPYRGMFNI